MQKELDKLSTDIVNSLCGLDMKYTFTSDEYDEHLKKIQNLDEFAQARFKQIEQSAKWILQRFKLSDGCKEEIDEIIRMATIGIEPDAKKQNAEIDRLATHILKHHAHEIGKGDFINGESTVDVAIRLTPPKR